jgi:60 kDa SS-A/Ro ribonucleoprotein
MRKMIRHVRSKRGQRTPLKGQVRNSAGGFSYRCSKWQALDRFLVLGTTSGSYYASGRSLTLERVKTVAVCLEANGAKTVDAVVAVSKSGRAPCNDQAILCLAMALKTGDEATRRRASKAVVHVCRTGTHLYQLAEAVSVFGGWGVLTRKAFASWFDARDGAGLAYQAIKYRNRNGWTARDVLRKAHVAPASAEAASVIDWMAHGWSGDLPSTAPEGARAQIWAFERAKSVDTAAEMARLIFDFRLPREAVPTHWLKSPLVWDALLQSGMPLGALVRNLGKLSSVGLLVDRSEASALVCERLTDKVALVRARMHPLKLLLRSQQAHLALGATCVGCAGAGLLSLVQGHQADE